MTTVACVWVNGHVPYSVEYVTRLAAMVAKWMDRPYRFVCLTDRPRDLPKGIETIRVPSPRPLFGWWAKIALFGPSVASVGRVLYLDLDTLIVGALAPLLDFPAPFALVPHAGDFNGREGLAVVKRFNSSVMVWDAGVPGRLFADWTPDIARRLHGDQDWVGEQMPDAATFPSSWCPRLSNVYGPPFAAGTTVILAKVPKNHIAAKKWPWFREIWRAA